MSLALGGQLETAILWGCTIGRYRPLGSVTVTVMLRPIRRGARIRRSQGGVRRYYRGIRLRWGQERPPLDHGGVHGLEDTAHGDHSPFEEGIDVRGLQVLLDLVDHGAIDLTDHAGPVPVAA